MLAALALGALPAAAAPPTAQAAPALLAMEQAEGDVDAHDFAFQGGERLPLLRLHDAALGTPRRDAAGRVSNTVLLLHATTGAGKIFLAPNLAGHLFPPGQPLDVQRTRSPHYGYVDQVEAQHAMLAGMGSTTCGLWPVRVRTAGKANGQSLLISGKADQERAASEPPLHSVRRGWRTSQASHTR